MIPANNGNAHKDNSDPQCATGKESDRSEMPDMPLGFFFWVTVSTYVYIYIYIVNIMTMIVYIMTMIRVY